MYHKSNRDAVCLAIFVLHDIAASWHPCTSAGIEWHVPRHFATPFVLPTTLVECALLLRLPVQNFVHLLFPILAILMRLCFPPTFFPSIIRAKMSILKYEPGLSTKLEFASLANG